MIFFRLGQDGDGIGFEAGTGSLTLSVFWPWAFKHVLHPVLSKWHPVLEDYESTKPAGVSPLEHERRWEKAKELRDAPKRCAIETNGIRRHPRRNGGRSLAASPTA
jgi:hypothetical protein